MKNITSYTTDGERMQHKSIQSAATTLGLNECSIRKALARGDGRVKGIQFKLEENTDEIECGSKLPREIDDELKRLGVDIKNVGTVWAKQMKNGSYRYSIKFDEKEKADYDDLLQAFKDHVTDSISLFIPPPVVPKQKSLLVYTSDKHVGAMTSANSLYKNDYNADVFERRMRSILTKIQTLAKENGPFKDLYIVDLGDPLDGLDTQTTRGGHALPQNMSNEQAFETFIKVHIEFFDTLVLSGAAKKIHFKAVTNDNHSGSFGYTAQRALEIYLNARYPQIPTTIDDKFMSHFEVGKHVFILTHGKDKRDRMRPMPLNLNDATKNFVSDYIDYHELTRPKGFIHLIKGDLHQAASQLTGKFRYRNVLSLYGASAWIQNNFGSQTIAGVAMDIIEDDKSTVMETNLILN